MKKALNILGLSLLVILLVTLIGPRNLKSGTTRFTSGTVSRVYQSGRDAVLRLTGVKTSFSFCRSFKPAELKQLLLGKKVKIEYKDCWTPLDPASNKEIAVLTIDEKVFYPEKP